MYYYADAMKRVNQLHSKINKCLCRDRHGLVRSLGGLKREIKQGRLKPRAVEKRIKSLEGAVERSVSKCKKRQESMPVINSYPDLPITKKKDAIIEAIRRHKVVIISGETGSGKTTQIPKFCMAAGRGGAGIIGCTQPRRIAAITVAARIAKELGVENTPVVGYKIRFDDKSSGQSIIKVMTDGILLAETQQDPFLNAYDTIIVDEAHERSLNIDFTLGILRNLVGKRSDLKLVITSATIDTEKFSKAFDDAPVIEVSGRMYPVELRYRPLETTEEGGVDDQGYVEAAAGAVDAVMRESRVGDILIFMPTEQDIGETMELLRGRGYPGLTVLPLFARLPAREQSRVFSKGAGRKIIVSTNVAETSLTIPGITYVIDTGLARIPQYSPRTRTTSLPVMGISKSSADQRKGRCGRVANGICIRLYDESDYGSRPFFTAPEILRSNLAEVILRMISLKLGDVTAFPFIDMPSFKSIKDGFATLLELGAIREKRTKKKKRTFSLTQKGRIMARIPVDPKLSRILIEADQRGCLDEAGIIVSALAVSDPRQRPQEKAQQADQKHSAFEDPASDFITLLNIWKAYGTAQSSLKTRGKVRKFCKENFLSFKRLREWSDIHRQIRSVLKEHGVIGKKRVDVQTGTAGLKKKEFQIGGPLYGELHKSLLCGLLAGIAKKKEKNIYYAAKGRKAMVFPGSSLFGRAGDWIVAAEFVETSQLFARTCANIDSDWLEALAPGLCTYTWSAPSWEKKRGEVTVAEQVSLFGLVIIGERRVGYGRINPGEAGEIFIRKALVEGEMYQPFPFMDHNQSLVNELRAIEEKTRRRDILVTDEDVFLFYRKRLEKDFFNLRTFARYLKERGDDSFLKMDLTDLQKKEPDGDMLENYPDYLAMGGTNFKLEYGFNPGDDRDGVTVSIPARASLSVSVNITDRLVPGLFREKVEALIRNLPKSFRTKLLPVSEKADIIAAGLPLSNRPLFSELSRFVKERFKVDIPAAAWSDTKIDDHLKMRLSIRDKQDREIAVSREESILKIFSDGDAQIDHGFEAVRQKLEKEGMTSWDFNDLDESIIIRESKDLSYEVYPGLQAGEKTVALCLFKTREQAEKSHLNGIRALYALTFPSDFNALEKDFRSSPGLKKQASLFGGNKIFFKALMTCITTELFSKNIRTKADFFSLGEIVLPNLYKEGQCFQRSVIALLEEYQKTVSALSGLSLKHQGKHQAAMLLERLHTALKDLVPETFLQIYTPDQITNLQRNVKALRIRARRGVVEPVKDSKKQARVALYETRLKSMIDGLSPDSSKEKRDAVEQFFWMIEEYKISLFAQELKTRFKVSPKRLDVICSDIALLI